MKKTLLVLALVAGFTSFAQNAQAELITINVGPSPGFNIDGINGGVAEGSIRLVTDFPVSSNRLFIFNNADGVYSGLTGDNGLGLPVAPVTPRP